MNELLLPLLVVLAAVAIAAVLSHLVARLVIRHGARHLLDQPGPRSSHVQATPRGGGIGIAIVLVVVIVALQMKNIWPISAPLVLLGVAVVTGVGLLDDIRSQPALLRLLAHLAASAVVVAALVAGRFPPLDWPWLALLVLALAWSINLHNFMDGIDGLLGLHALFCGSAFALLYALEQEPAMTLFAALLAGAALGFLPLNWPRARVFLGDSGSGVIGLAIGLLVLYGAITTLVPLPVGLVLCSAFLVDSGATLVLRMLRRERFWQAHREHLYQRLVQVGHRHAKVSAGYLLWNLVVAAPTAAWLQSYGVDAGWGWPVALALLLSALTVWFLLGRHCRRVTQRREAT